jgi:anaphase-promoting complex subunit 4
VAPIWYACQCSSSVLLIVDIESLSPAAQDSGAMMRHDVLEVNQYFLSGLKSSSLDKWFLGPLPTFENDDLIRAANGSLRDTLDDASVFINGAPLKWQQVRLVLLYA